MKDSLIDKDEFINATNLHKFRLEIASGLLMKITGISSLNKVYQQVSQNQNFSFIRELLKELDITIEMNEAEFENIPKEGGFITISNHPFGMLDGILLIYLVASRRSDFKVMANFLLKKIKPIENYFIPVNPFDNKSLFSSVKGLKSAVQHLENNSTLGIFPAGEVASIHPKGEQFISDSKWHNSSIKLIKNAKLPVIPIYFKGGNSVIFQLLGLIHPGLRTATLASEFVRKKGAHIKIRIGRPISVKDQERFENINDFSRYLRAKTYALNSAVEVKRFYIPKLLDSKKEAEIVEPVNKEILIKEIETLSEFKITERNEFEVYLCKSDYIPNILREIGRLRELTFRQVGEGTDKELDLDSYDLYYQHLFIWDNENSEIIAAYRIGKGLDIIRKFGKKGFYINSLFKFSKDFDPYLEKSIELGRSFVVPHQQRKPLPLFLLWKGILHTLLSNPEYLYIIGPVSVSNTYTKLSKSLLVAYIKKYHYNQHLASMVRARKNYKVKSRGIDFEILMKDMDKSTFNQLDNTIAGIESSHLSIPVLLKKYIKENAEIIAFNVDPKFNNTLDGLMILDLKNLNQETVDKLNREIRQA